jgi:N-acetylmuramoyl-L-alanine amidase
MVFSQERNKITKVVIDAGHGGYDPGALGAHCKEKNIALAIALKTGEYIKKNLKDVKVVYTRKTDKFVELHKRAQIANDSKADFFISIHCNSLNSNKVHGAETYVMGLHKNEANLAVAKKENASILYEDNYNAQYEGFNPNSPEANVIFSLYQNAYLDQSLNLAQKVQKQFKTKVGLKDRGVLQAGFWVLYKTTMPGILIETGYLSHDGNEKFLMSKDGQTYIASAIYRAFKEYKIEFEKENKNLLLNNVIKKEKTDDIRFRVQFASYKRKKPVDSKKFSKLRDVRYYFHKGLYKYTVGNELSVNEAEKLQSELRNKGFKDAFVVAFINENRISTKNAIEKLKK